VVRDQPAAFRVPDQKVEKKLDTPLQNGIYVLEKLFVPGEKIMLPEMSAEPGAPRGEGAPVRAIRRRREIKARPYDRRQEDEADDGFLRIDGEP
jgi:hypothetical protein